MDNIVVPSDWNGTKEEYIQCIRDGKVDGYTTMSDINPFDWAAVNKKKRHRFLLMVAITKRMEMESKVPALKRELSIGIETNT